VKDTGLSCTYLKESANFAGRMASSGSVKKAMPKQTAAPARHDKNPSNLRKDVDKARERGREGVPHLSQRERAKYASCSLEFSLDRNGIYAPPTAL
jgi:hypothetical protein